MSVIAVICEYNPFHLGHEYQLKQIRERFGQDSTIISLMSGSTVQRGEIAVASKYNRAAGAICCGSDLVLELPYPYCSSVAEQFALGAVSILCDIGVVDHLVFGSESSDISSLELQAKRRNSDEFLNLLVLKRKEFSNLSYPQLVDLCYTELYGEPFAKGPNDILGVFYLKSLMDLNSSIKAHCHLRLEGASATNARRKLRNGENDGIAEAAKPYFSQPCASLEYGTRAILYTLRNCQNQRIASAAYSSSSITELMQKLGNKNATDAKIRREILHSILGYCEKDFSLPKFTTVLAMNPKGAALLHKMKRTSSIEIITKPSDYRNIPEICEQFELNLRSDELFALCCDQVLPQSWSLRETPFVKK